MEPFDLIFQKGLRKIYQHLVENSERAIRQRIPKGQSKWTIQINWQHRVHKTKKHKTKNKTEYVLDTTMYK
jgi:hypothetical protein